MQKNNTQIALYLIVISLLSYCRVGTLNDLYWDDNCWLLSRFANDSLAGFLDDGFNQMGRIPLGVFLYAYYGLDKLTEHALIILQSFNVLLYLSVPILLFLLASQLAGGNRLYGVAAATVFIVVPLDHTMPYLTAVNYRLGLPLELLSFLLTWRAVSLPSVSRRLIFFALLLDIFTQYVLIEAAVALVPVRIFMIWYASRFNVHGGYATSRVLGLAVVFVVPMIPLVLYKLIFRPYGLYESMYAPDPGALVDWRKYYDLAGMLFFGFWRLLAPKLSSLSGVGIAFAVTAMLATLAASWVGATAVQAADAPISDKLKKQIGVMEKARGIWRNGSAIETTSFEYWISRSFCGWHYFVSADHVLVCRSRSSMGLR